MRQDKEIPTEGIYIFKSCQVSAEYPGVESSTLYAFDKLGVKYFNDPMQCCCTGMGYYSDLFPFRTVTSLAARNLCLAARSQHPNIAVFCSTCYAVNKKCTEVLKENREVLHEVNDVLSGIGMRYDNELDVRANHFSTVEILWKLRSVIKEKAVIDFKGITVAAHPACHYCKVFHEDVVTDPAFPTVQDEIAEELGARSIRRFQEKLLTCGAGFRQRFTNKGLSLAVTQAKLRELHRAGVDILLHMCPNCHVQYDRYQPLLAEVSRTTYKMVHLHIQQLVALALGAHPYKVVGLQTHSVEVEPLLKRLEICPKGERGGQAMSIKIRMPTPLRRFTGNQSEILTEGHNVKQVFEDLERQFPGIRERLYDGDGSLRRFINFYVNGEDIRYQEGERTPVKDGDVISITPAIAGGLAR